MDFDHQLKTANRMLYEAEEGKKIALLRKTNFKLFGFLNLYSKFRNKYSL